MKLQWFKISIFSVDQKETVILKLVPLLNNIKMDSEQFWLTVTLIVPLMRINYWILVSFCKAVYEYRKGKLHLYHSLWTSDPVNEWVASNRIPVFAQRTLGSSGGKHCKSLEGNVRRKVVSTPENMVLGRDQSFFAVILSQMDFGNVDTWKM